MIRDRSAFRGSEDKGKSSIEILPEFVSSRRRIVSRSEDLPLPVRPQMPTFVPREMLIEKLCKIVSSLELDGI